MYEMKLSTGVLQLKKVNFFKMGVADIFPEYTQTPIKRKVKKEPKEEPQFVVDQTIGTQDQPVDLEFGSMSQQTRGSKPNLKGIGFFLSFGLNLSLKACSQ